MKITEKLKAKLDNAVSAEEAEKILAETKKGVEDAGIILDDAELNEAVGGGTDLRLNSKNYNYGNFFQ